MVYRVQACFFFLIKILKLCTVLNALYLFALIIFLLCHSSFQKCYLKQIEI